MFGDTFRNEAAGSGLNQHRMVNIVRSVAASWVDRLRPDPQYDADDLAQELYIRYVSHFRRTKQEPGPLSVRRWAWDIMRQWGYRGRNGGLLKCNRLFREISFCGHVATKLHDITDEEIVDSIYYFPNRKSRKWDDE